MEQLAERLKGLSDPTRLRVLRLLAHGKLCVCDLTAGLDLPQSTVSRHMSFLKKGGWVESSRKGKWIYYVLAAPEPGVQQRILEALLEHLPEREEARQDWQRLKAHLRIKTGACA